MGQLSAQSLRKVRPPDCTFTIPRKPWKANMGQLWAQSLRKHRPPDAASSAVRMAVAAVANAVFDVLQDEGLAGLTVSSDLVKSLAEAIVDSGASFTYVSDRVKLTDASPGGGQVWVADGRSESIAEMGNWTIAGKESQKLPKVFD